MADLFSNPNDLALASMGLRLMSTPGKFGPALGTSGLGALQDLQWAQQVAKQRQMQERVLAERQEELRRKRAEEDAAKLKETQLDAAYRGAFVSPAEQALSGGGGPTVGNAAAMQGLRPQISQDRLIEGLMKIDPRLAFQMAQPKPRKLTSVAPGASVIDEADPSKPVFTAPDRQKELNPNQPFMMIDGKMVPNQAYQDYELRKAATGRPDQRVVIADKSFKDESDVRKEFNALPEVQGYKLAVPAYSAVVDASQRLTPQSDINIIYGIAKLYDPTSVVREGEYATIANSQAIPERIKSLAQQLAGKGKLTPETRAQLVTEANSRMAVLKREYDAAQRTYQGLADRRGIDPRNIFTPINEATAPANAPAVNKWSITKVE